MGFGLSAAFAIIVSGMLLVTGMAVTTMENASRALNDGRNDRYALTLDKEQTKVWIAYAIILNNTTSLGLDDNISENMLVVLCFNTGSKSVNLENVKFFINGNVTNRVKSMRTLNGAGETKIWNESGWLKSSLWAPDNGLKVFFDVGAVEGDIITVVTDNGISASGAVSSGRLGVDIGPDIEIFEKNTESEEGPDHDGTITLSANVSVRSIQTNLDWYNALKWSPDIEKIVNAGEYYRYAWDADAADGVDFENPSSIDSVFTVQLASRDLNNDGIIDPYIITVQVTDMITGETTQDNVRVLVRDCTPPKLKPMNVRMLMNNGSFAVNNLWPIVWDLNNPNPYYQVNEDTEVMFNAAIDDQGTGLFTDNVAKINQLRYAWDFDGDGKFDTQLSNGSDALIVTHTFSNPLRNLTNNNDLEEANYTVRLYVADMEGNWNMTSQKVRVLDNTPPIAYFDVYPTPALQDRPVTFYGSLSTDNFCNSTDLYYQWTLGTVYGYGTYPQNSPGWGSDYSTEPVRSWYANISGVNTTVMNASVKENGYMNPTITFYLPGEYNITLTVWDYRERQQTPIPAGHTYSRRVIILDTTPPTITNPTVLVGGNRTGRQTPDGFKGGVVGFDATLSDNSGGKIFWTLYYNNTSSADWNLGLVDNGGSVSQTANPYNIDSFEYTYGGGNYAVTAELRMWDDYGNVNSCVFYINVTP